MLVFYILKAICFVLPLYVCVCGINAECDVSPESLNSGIPDVFA